MFYLDILYQYSILKAGGHMRLSAKSEYAFLALIDLAEQRDNGLVRIEDIAKRKNIPKKFLEQILLLLKKAGYVKSKRGAVGGYSLSKKPNQLTLAEIIRLMDGPLAPVSSASTYYYEASPIEQNRPLLAVMKDIRDNIADKLQKTTLADLV